MHGLGEHRAGTRQQGRSELGKKYREVGAESEEDRPQRITLTSHAYPGDALLFRASLDEAPSTDESFRSPAVAAAHGRVTPRMRCVFFGSPARTSS